MTTSTPTLERPPSPEDRTGRHRRRPRDDGGLPARRAVVRWAWRLFRREWRQQVLVLALLTLAVAVAVGGSAAVYGMVSTDDRDLGTATDRIDLSTGGRGAQPAAEVVANATAAFGRVDVIGRTSVPIAGSVDPVELRAQDPDGPFGAPMLRLVDGRYPTAADEVAVTDQVAALLHVDVGDPVDLGGTERTVVGRVENPANLDDDAFALVAADQAEGSEALSLLVDAREDQFKAFQRTVSGSVSRLHGGQDSAAMAAALTLAMATVVLLLVSLIAAAGFVVLAQRRLRQLGMLSAIGATERHLRLVMVANGVVVGIVAALAGTALGIGGWVVVAPHLEHAAARRIDAFQFPWWLVAAGMALAVVTATAAAWWPSRAMARIPVVQALSGRPPRPRPAHRSVLVAVVLVVVGVLCLARGVHHDSVVPLLVVAGTLATALGVLFLSPAAVRALPAVATRLPLAARLALRDLGRNQARSGAALAAISLGLGIPVAVVVIAGAAQYTETRDAGLGNLADDQLLLHVGNPPEIVPELTADELDGLQGQVEALADSLDTTLVPLDAVVDPAMDAESGFGGPGDGAGPGGRMSDLLAERVGEQSYHGHVVVVATPELLALAGVDPGSVDPSTEVLTSVRGDLFWIPKLGQRGREPVPVEVESIDGPGYTSLPQSLMTPEAVEHQGWEAARSGWLLQADHPLTGDQLQRAHDAATGAGLYLETRRGPGSTATLRNAATAVGLLVALGILAMTVGLLRSEAAGDLRTLTATGASSRVRRAVTAATAAALALLGALLGTLGAYVALVASYLDDLAPLGDVPVVHLAVILVGLPAVAALAGWLLAGREPPVLARRPLE
jgi:putative ABC transport system permease protein